jgi:hypothetical protein
VFLAWTASFAVCYVVSLKTLSQNGVLINFWSGHFPPFPWWSLRNLPWLVDQWFQIVRDAGGLDAFVGGTLFMAGCGAMFLRNRAMLGMLIAPAALAVLASGLHAYPLAGRLMLFFVPNMLLLTAEGTAAIAEKVRYFPAIACVLLGTLIVAHPIEQTFRSLVYPRYPEDIRSSISYIRSHEKPGDRWYIYHLARYQFWYYEDLYRLPARNVQIGIDCGNDVQCYAKDLDTLHGKARVWVLFSHIWIGDGINEEQVFLQHLDRMGKRLDSYSSIGARAYLYDLSLASLPDPKPNTANEE